jgi:hypothetical protein
MGMKKPLEALFLVGGYIMCVKKRKKFIRCSTFHGYATTDGVEEEEWWNGRRREKQSFIISSHIPCSPTDAAL